MWPPQLETLWSRGDREALSVTMALGDREVQISVDPSVLGIAHGHRKVDLWPEPQKKPHLSLAQAESSMWGLACSTCMYVVRRVTPLSFAVHQVTVYWGGARTGCQPYPYTPSPNDQGCFF